MDQVWKLLAELPQGSDPSADTAQQHVVDVLRNYDAAPACLERIGSAVAAAVSRARQNSSSETVCVRIYVSGVNHADPEQKQGWGFYVVEKPAVHKESFTDIELFLFTEGEE